MAWYYARAHKKMGPVEEREFMALVEKGRIADDTMVWRPGMSQWRPYGFLTGRDAAGNVPCAECGRLANPEEMVRYEGIFLCAECKNVFFQRVREGVQREKVFFSYAGFWIRGAAKIVDLVIVSVLLSFYTFYLRPKFTGFGPVVLLGLNMAFLYIPYFALGLVYTTFFLGIFSATPGKMLFGLIVIKRGGGRIDYMDAFGRQFGELVSQMTLMIGYFMAAFDVEKRALHDRILDTRVIRKP